MDILSLIVLVLAIVKKDKRCLPVCVIACVYACAHAFYRLPAILGTIFFKVFSIINIPILVILLLASILTFYKPFENGRKYRSSIIFSAGILVIRIVRKTFFHNQLQQFVLNETVVLDSYDVLTVGYTIIDSLFAILFLGFMICIIVVLNRDMKERTS